LGEGFFADLVVLVEGPSDRAAVAAAASIAGLDLEANGVAILAATGKTGLANPACIFQELQIPTFIVWDCDHGSADPKIPYNHALQRISGVAEANVADYTSAVGDRSAAFEIDLEATVRAELGDETFDRCLDAARDKFGLQSRGDVSKSPAAMTDVLQSAKSREKTSATLHRIVEAITTLRRAQQPAD
jgi:predicted ATP-dependent endonuclease of OLD family